MRKVWWPDSHLSFLFLGDGQEIVVEGQAKVFKDVTELLESVSMHMIVLVISFSYPVSALCFFSDT